MEKNTEVHIVNISRDSLAISHLLYVDDLLIVGRENLKNA